MRPIGLLTAGTAASLPASLFTEMRELGWVEGQNLLIERRTGDGQANRVPALGAELVQLRVDVIVILGAVAALAAKKATATIPIVATTGDPVAFGLVSNVSRPGGNITGIALVAPQLAPSVSMVETKLIPGGTNRRRLRANCADSHGLLTVRGQNNKKPGGCIHMKLAPRIVVKE